MVFGEMGSPEGLRLQTPPTPAAPHAPRQRRCQVPARVLMALASVVSTGVSFAGGYWMYLEGLRQLQDTVEELSHADALLGAAAIQRSFDEVRIYTESYAELFARWSPSTLSELQRFLFIDQWAKTVTSSGLWSLGIAYIPLINTMANSTAMLQWVWFDALSDPDYIERNNGSSKQWINGVYLPPYYGHPSCAPAEGEYPPARKFCVFSELLHSKTGVPQRNVYNWSDGNINRARAGGEWDHLQAGWRDHGAQWWRGLSIWTSEDGTPLLYSALHHVLPYRGDIPLFRDVKLMLMTYITSYRWQAELFALASEATLVVSCLNEGLESRVLATNSGEPLIVPGCSRADASAGRANRCVVTLRAMPRAVQDAAVHLNASQPNTFQRHDISGGEHWMRRRPIFISTPGRDGLPSIWLLWMQDTDSIQGKADRSLLNFILFIIGVVVFDAVILLIEFLKIGSPLGRVVAAVRHMNEMDVQGAGRVLQNLDGGVLVVTEIAELAQAFRVALASLQTFREFIPQSCFTPVEEQMHAEAEFLACPTEPPPGAGEVCVVFTDVQSSTALWEWSPQVMRAALCLHDVLVRRVAAARLGYEVKVIGDAFMLVFHTAPAGLGFALDCQRALVQAEWPQELLEHTICRRVCENGRALWCGLRVRIGVHFGEVYAEENPVTRRCDYYGPTVNVAARMESAARHGGLTAVTDVVLAACGGDELAALGSPVVIPSGASELKGVTGMVRVNIVLPPELEGRRSLLSCATPLLAPPKRPRRLSAVSIPSRRSPMPADLVQPMPDNASSVRSSSISSMTTAPVGISPADQHRYRTGLHMTQVNCSVVSVRCALTAATPVELNLPQLLQVVEHNAEFSRGVVLGACSASVLVTWNATHACPDHSMRAFHFTTGLATNDESQTPRHLGGSGGTALVGNLQAGPFRHSVVVGGCMEFALLLAAEAELCHDVALLTGGLARYGASTGAIAKAQLWYTPERGEQVVWELLWGQERGCEDFGRWQSILCRTDTDRAVPLDDLIPHLLFVEAARGQEAAKDALRLAAARAPGDARVRATRDRLERGTLRARCVPPSVTFLDTSNDLLLDALSSPASD
eukprot:TRINITY_DN2503_c0_g2_i5.p1 TRINITY_DN2503_c0_g2~~TRINITY_DN2503_c0_g2_i5.p1  ORF type:complete len:1092 (+),score=310.93 TRINITY_DN2503_c0_g2_i5:66-3341(+)